MSRTPDDPESLDSLVTRTAQLEARDAARTARADVLAKREEDRLTWLLGRLLRDGMATDPALRAWVQRELPPRLTERDRQRDLWARLFPGETCPEDREAP